jgi:membrane fusion protein, copper/silver efflux system
MAISNNRRGFVVPGAMRAFRIAATRLRFLYVFAIVFAIIGCWETIRTYTARLMKAAVAEPVTSSDTEYFCPMDPGILSDWPSKCPVCNMTLVRRKRGEAVPLPDGVMARMQLTPYRLWLGGIKTDSVDFAALEKTIELPGTVREISPGHVRIEADVFPRELTWIEAGQTVDVIPIPEDGGPAIPGKINDVPKAIGAGSVGKVIVAAEGKTDTLEGGGRVRIRVRCPVERVEPFRSQPSTPPPLLKGEPRRLYTCMEHADVVSEAAGACPRDKLELMARPLRDDQRVRWWCPMHPAVTADRSGAKCEACGGMALVPRVVTYRPPGKVLGVPCSAVIDDGSQALVYVERGAGMFDARVVTLGVRCGAMFPVVSGLEPGDRVAAQGAFLIDAETRLNPSLATGYFGAAKVASAREPAAPVAKAAALEGWANGLALADRPRALLQKLCPVTDNPLGSMGVPPKITVRGRAVFLCCKACAAAVEADPDTYLAKLPRNSVEGAP